MIKVCILTTVHPPFDGRIFHKEAKSLVTAGYDVTLVAQHGKEERVDGIRIVPLPRPKNRIARMTKTVWQAYRKALEVDADIYHFHDPELIPVGLLLNRYGKKVIYDAHEDVPRQNLGKIYIPVLFRKPISAMIEILEHSSVRFFDGVITATPFINRRFLKYGANSVNVNNYPLLSESHWVERQWERKERAVCYVGTINDMRGAVEMVDAIGKIGCRLLLAGDFEAGIENKLRQMPGWRQVEVLGIIDRTCVLATMARSIAGIVLLHPIINYIDALPTKMFEYMSAGIPVIASNFPLWQNIVEGTKCGICVNPLDNEAIVKSIKFVIDHPEEASQMGENGRKAVEERYNWGAEEKKLLNLYSNITQER